MSSNSDFYEDFSSLSSPASLASGESWQDIQEELPNVPQAGDSPKLFHSEKTQEQELDDISHDTDDLNFSPGEDSTLPCPADSMEANVQAAGTIQHSMTQKLLSFSDGNIDLVIGNNKFRLHEYKLEEFTTIKDMIEVKRRTQGGEINASPLQITLGADVDDVCNTLSILYSPVYATKTHNFGVDVLKSTLRFATRFQHPALRSFAIYALEKNDIPPIERIIMSRQSNVPSWMRPALDELCVREAPISFREAVALGTKTFVEVAARREVHKSMAGNELVAFKAALRNRMVGGSDSVESRSGFSLVVDSQQIAGHNSTLDRIIKTAFSIIGSEASSEGGS